MESPFAREYTPDNHTASSGVSSKYYGGRILRREEIQVCCQTILKPAGEGELGCEPISSWTSSVLTNDTFANTHCRISAYRISCPKGSFIDSPRQYPCSKLSCMPLDLVPMLIHTPKIVSATMNVKHDPFAALLRSFPSLVIHSRLDPLSLQTAPSSSPLPPLAASNLVDTLMPELCNYGFGGIIN